MGWQNRLAIALTVLVLAGAFAAAWQGMDAPIRVVEITGELSAAEKAEVSALVSGRLEGGVLSADIDALGEALLALSWPSEVGVRRQWPDKLTVNVAKASVIARWSDQGYLTSRGEVVTLAQPRHDLPRLDAAHATPIAAMEMYRTLAALASPLKLSVISLKQNLLGEWTVRFDNGVALMLGSEHVADRMNRFAYAYATRLSNRESGIVHVDARYANGLAVRFSELIAGSSGDALGQ